MLISLLKELENAKGVGVDQSCGALEVAQKNAARHSVLERAQFIKSNWLDNVSGRFDVIVSNPPYIPEEDFERLDGNVKNFDPKRALVGGKDGLDCYRDIIKHAKTFLNSNGWLVFEVGLGQSSHVVQLLDDFGFQRVSVHKDLSGINRCVLGKVIL